MVSEDRLKAVMAAMLDLNADAIDGRTSTDTVPQWDSVRHMNLVIALEEEFDITIPDDEVVTLTSYDIIKATVEEQLANG
jgi:acyl carrier protein